MDALINSVVPPIGTYCLTVIKGGKPRQVFYTDKNDLVADGLTASAAGGNAYYAMASFNDDSARTQDNVLAIKSFWLDVDCKDKDPAKDYANKDDGLIAIQSFCKSYGFPRPSIVDSGNGWHVYWALTQEQNKNEWQVVADKLKALCLQSGLRIDPACTADSARILRIPNTKNYRFNPPSDVVQVLASPEVDFEGFSAIVEMGYRTLPAPAVKLPAAVSTKKLSAVTKSLIGNKTASFKKIMQRCMAGTGCQQILDAASNQDTIDYYTWWGALTVAHHCTDRDIAIHAISKNHPDYDPNKVEAKASDNQGPRTCSGFDDKRSGVCQNCQHWGKITSPIQLGHELAASVGPVTVAIAPPATPLHANLAASATSEASKLDMNEAEQALSTYNQSQLSVTIPPFPFPYLRGQNGGIYKRVRSEDGTFNDIPIYENDLYAYARMYDDNEGQVLAMRLHLPKDGVRYFNMPLRSVGARDQMRNILCSVGVAASEKNLQEIGNFIIASTRELQQMQAEEKARVQMGWQKDGTFVIGAREYSPSGIRNCPATAATANYQAAFTIQGSMREWRKMIDLYNQPGFAIQKFAFFVMTSSPLYYPVKHPGILLSLISDESGLGKTTLAKLALSVWGHHGMMTSFPQDTVNAATHKMGVMGSLPILMDEMTNKPAHEVSDLIYMTTHGRAKNRMSASANVERNNDTQWNHPALTTANASMGDKVSTLKASNEGEQMRLMEFDVRNTPILDKSIVDPIFALMETNYGLAGHLIASWCVKNAVHLPTLVKRAQVTMDARFKFSTKERNWSLAVACAYTMAYVTKELGIHDWDIEENIVEMIHQFDLMRGRVGSSVISHDGVLGDFLLENNSNILRINGLPDANGLMPAPPSRVIHHIMARYEPDTKILYVTRRDLRDYCARRQFSYESLKTMTGAKEDVKRMAAGTGIIASSVKVLRFDTAAAGLNMDLWNDEEPNAPAAT